MATILKSLVQFVNVAANGVATLPHGLVNEDVAQIPDRADCSNSAFQILSVTSTQVQIQNNGPAAASCNVLCERWHSQERVITTPNLTVQPFIPAAEGQGGSAGQFMGFFGDGSDGDVVLVGDLDIDGDAHYNNLDTAGFNINVGVPPNEQGCIFVRNRLTIRTGSHVNANGGDALQGAAGASTAGNIMDSGADGGQGLNIAGQARLRAGFATVRGD